MFRKSLAALFACCALSASSKPLTIVANAHSDYVIAVAPNATEGARVAANDLKEYIRKATGADLPVVKPQNINGRPAFRLAFDKVALQEGFTVKIVGKDICISGDDTPGDPYNIHWMTGARVGTWYGVADFLEKNLGIRWFYPGEMGEYVPKTDILVIDDSLDYSEKPRFEMRRMGYISNASMNDAARRECNKWLRRNRAGNASSWCAWHSWLRDFKGSDYFKDHPEWFALVDGRRYGNDAGGYGLKMCTTNSEALDQYAKNLIENRKKSSRDYMMTLSPNDSGNFCECENCTKLDNGVRPDGSRIMTDRMMTYANEVARRVKKVLPNQTFGMYAYGFFAECGNVQVDPSITIEEVHNDNGMSYYNPETRARHLANLKAWRKKLAKLYVYVTPEGMGNLALPSPQFRNICMLYDNLYAADVTGHDMNNSTCFAAGALNNYFYLKFCWADVKDREKFYRDSLEKCYGKIASTVVFDYFEDIEKRFTAMANKKNDEDRALGYIPRFPTVLDVVYPGLADAWLAKLNDALDKTTDKNQKARLQTVVDCLEYCDVTCKLYAIATKVVKTPKPDAGDVSKADNLAQQRQKLLPRLAAFPSNLYIPSVAATEKNYRLPFDRKVFSYMLAANGKKTGKALRIMQPPVIDGKLDDDCWKTLPVMRIEHDKDTGVTHQDGADARIAITENAIVIGIRCQDSKAEEINDTMSLPTSAVWNENNIDIFMDPSGCGKTIYQLCSNSLGTARTFVTHEDQKGTEWKANATVATTKDASGWSIEIAIPLVSFESLGDFRGNIWGMNFCRVRTTVKPSEYSCWSPTFGDFHRPERFGKMVMH